MTKVFLYAAETGTSKASGKPYTFQRCQIVQSPDRPDVLTRHFIPDGEQPLAPGAYTCEVYFRDGPTGLRVNFHKFAKA